MSKYDVRPASSTDIPEVVAHVTRILQEFGLTFGVGSKSDGELLELSDAYEKRGGAFWVARSANGSLIGTAGVVRIDPVTFELRKMYLAPEARGQGVGSMLFKAALTHVRERKAERLVLDTIDEMRDAIAFYERHGFVRDDVWKSAPRCTRGYVLTLEGGR